MFEDFSSRQWSALSAVLLLVAVGVLVLVLAKGPSIIQTPDGTVLRSSALDAQAQLKEYRRASRVIVSPAFLDGSGASGQLANAATIAVVLSAGNDQNVIQLYRQLSPAGDLVSCLSNAGDPKTVVELSKADCEAFLNAADANSLLIKIESQRNPGEPASLAVLSPSTLSFYFAPTASADRAVFEVLKGTYPNAEKVLASAQAFLNRNSNAVAPNQS